MVASTWHQAQANEKVKRFNVIMILRLSHYEAENQKDFDTVDFPITYLFNVQVNQTARVALLRLKPIRLPLGPAMKVR